MKTSRKKVLYSRDILSVVVGYNSFSDSIHGSIFFISNSELLRVSKCESCILVMSMIYPYCHGQLLGFCTFSPLLVAYRYSQICGKKISSNAWSLKMSFWVYPFPLIFFSLFPLRRTGSGGSRSRSCSIRPSCFFTWAVRQRSRRSTERGWLTSRPLTRNWRSAANWLRYGLVWWLKLFANKI